MTIDLKKLREAFGSFMTGVAIVTAKAKNGDLVGFTANSFTSVSLEPPLLLVCPGYHLSSIETFRECAHFAVNILGENQQGLANAFASSTGDRFANTKWHQDKYGSPVISGSIASFSCSTHAKKEAGDHLILIGRVSDFTSASGMGLGYWKGGYFSLGKERQANVSSSASEKVVAGALIEFKKQIYGEQSHCKLRLPTINIQNKTQARAGVESHLTNLGISASMGPVYSIFFDPKKATRYIYFRCDGHSASLPKNSAGQFIDLQTAATSDWADAGERAIVKRYLTERETNQFGLYVGDHEAGEVHHEQMT